MWVADMDFRPPPEVTAAVAAEIDHGVFGYYGDDRAYKAAIAGWMSRRHGWEVDPAAIATTHGVVAGLALCLQAFSEPGDGGDPVLAGLPCLLPHHPRQPPRDRGIAAGAARTAAT